MPPRDRHDDTCENESRRNFVKSAIGLGAILPFLVRSGGAQAGDTTMLIDDFTSSDLVSKLGTRWRGVSDQVMGGVSEGKLNYDTILGRNCLRIRGDVRLDNNGGFIQAGLDLGKSMGLLDASRYTGMRLAVYGNGEKYSLHLRTPDNTRPWQSYRAHFTAPAEWESIDLSFEVFTPYRLEVPLDLTQLRRIGLVAIGRAFHADLAVAKLQFYR